MAIKFKKITQYNGFDSVTDNARQNNYAWSMAEMDNYIYVGTGRNLVYAPIAAIGLETPKEITPDNVDMRAEIWRYDKSGSTPWELKYKAPEGIIGFRFMINYTTPAGERALYTGCYNLDNRIILLKSTDGETWDQLNTTITDGNSTRAIINHNNKLYMSVIKEEFEDSATYIYSSNDPQNDGWTLETPPDAGNYSPQGQAVVMCSFNNKLYIATALSEGFQVWRTAGSTPAAGWQLVVDKGGGDAACTLPLTMGVFKNYVYVGTAIHTVPLGDSTTLFPRGFDLIRIDRNDNWELVIGSPALIPARTVSGSRGLPSSGLLSGCGDITNAYCWQLTEYQGTFYLGTFTWSSSVELIYRLVQLNADKLPVVGGNPIFQFLVNNSVIARLLIQASDTVAGFDLWSTEDGVRWKQVVMDGLGNPNNYGARNLFVSENGKMYLGTANPFEGCEVWESVTNVPPAAEPEKSLWDRIKDFFNNLINRKEI